MNPRPISLSRDDRRVSAWAVLAALCLALPALPGCGRAEAGSRPAVAAPPAPAVAIAPQETAAGKVLKDEWSLSLLGDARIGYEHTRVEEVMEGGERLYNTITESRLNLKRLGQGIEIGGSGSVLEDENGQIRRIRTVQDLSTVSQTQDIRVTGNEAEMTMQTVGRPSTRTIPWKPEYLGPRAREKLLHEALRAGETTYEYEDWAPGIGPTTVTQTVVGREAIELPDGSKQELLHVSSRLSATPMVVDEYLDQEFRTRLSVVKQMGLEFKGYPATREECLAAVKNPDSPDVMIKASPPSNVRLPDPHQLDEVVLRIRGLDPELGFPEMADERQTVTRRISELEAEVTVRRRVPGVNAQRPVTAPTAEEATCLAANAYLQCDDARLVRLARTAIGGETDLWKAACRLERFVHRYIDEKNFGTGFASALEILDGREGDCTEHGVLHAAMCRAVGIPARVAIGLLYFQGIWGGHMWTEVSVNGDWYALDATLGYGGIGASHLRFAADSLETGQIESAFSNMASAGGNLDIDVLSFRRGDKTVVIAEQFTPHEVGDGRYRNLLFSFSLDLPEGFEFDPKNEVGLGKNEVLEVERKEQSREKVEISIMAVPESTTFEDLLEVLMANAEDVETAPLEIDGRKALKVTARSKAGTPAACVLIRRGQSMIRLEVDILNETTEAALEAVLQSLDLDG